MAMFKCKMCGGDLEIAAGESVAECQYCGSKQTLPRFDSERKVNLYDRANHFRRNNEFDKAEGIYEQILNEDLTDAEAYWSLVLCRYGIEYVEDPTTHKRIPTVNRAQYTSVFADENYKKAIENAADTLQRELYEAEAKAIDEIQRGILEISEKEDPFDVFICYKETDAQGRRTTDSVLANELYHELTNEGFKVFFSRITLEDKLGTAYEPYIFAALHSAKVMVVLGTKPEYFNAVWVKNEWSRYLALIRAGEKKTLIPAYRDMDPYDLPEEFSHLQAQDMSKLGFMPDLVRGIRKIVEADRQKETVKETVVIQQSAGGTNLSAQLKRGMIALEDHDWNAADGFFDKALDMDPESAEAYFGKTLAAAQCESGAAFVQKRIAQARPNKETLTACDKDDARVEDAVTRYVIPEYLSADAVKKCFTYDERTFGSYTAGWESCITKEKSYWERDDRNLSRALRYAKGEPAQQYQALRDSVISAMEEKLANNRLVDENEKARLTQLYTEEMEKASQKAAELYGEAVKRREADYESCCQSQEKAATWAEYEKAAMSFERDGMRGYKDCDERAAQCQAEADRLKAEEKAETERRAAEEKAAAEAKAKAEAEERERQRIATEKAAAEAKKKKTTIGIIAGAVAVVVIAAALIVTKVIIPGNKYKQAEAMLAAGDYDGAIAAFEALGSFRDSAAQISAAEDAKTEAENARIEAENAEAYEKATAWLAAGEYDKAIDAFRKLGNYEDSISQMNEAKEVKHLEELATAYSQAESDLAAGDFDSAINGFIALKDYRDSAERILEAQYAKADAYENAGDCFNAAVEFGKLAPYSDSWERCLALWGKLSSRETVSAGSRHTVAVRTDGSVVAAGATSSGQCDINNWKKIVSVSAGYYYTVGLRADGTVVAVGNNRSRECDVEHWEDIVAVSAGDEHTVGLKSDGTVVATGKNSIGQCNVSNWQSIVAVSAGKFHTVGLMADGTVIATGMDLNGQCNVSSWHNIVAVSAGDSHSVGLCADGTVVAAGYDYYGQCDVSDWKDILSVSASEDFTVGLRKDGTVVAVGYNTYGQCNVSDWRDIVAIATGTSFTVGLRADGTVVATEYIPNEYVKYEGQCDVAGWSNIRLPD